MGVSMLPAHCCPASFLVFLWDYQPLSVSYVQVSKTNSGLSKLLQHVSTVMQVCVWLRCSQLWRRAFYDLCLLRGKTPPACSPSSYFSLSFFSPTVSSLSFSPSPYSLPFFTFQLICPFPWTLSASSTPSFIPVLVGVVGPPPFPSPSLFFLSSLLNRSPSFLFLALRRGPSDSQMVKPKKKEGGRWEGLPFFFFLCHLFVSQCWPTFPVSRSHM